MFCDCKNDPEERRPNINVCPVCLAHPGTLPVANRAAIEHVLLVGMALKGDIPASSKFDRKNYFYPDLPKGYQISQYDVPLVFGGMLKGVRLTRVHLEEDTGRLSHSADRIAQSEKTSNDSRLARSNPNYQLPITSYSLVDFNRAGVPLMELVTEPDIKDADQAVAFAKELQLILRYLGVSDADMEKGQMRVEANVSLGTIVDGLLKLGTKVEVKNIASFKAVHDTIEYELKRQAEVLESGEKVKQETRGWDDVKRATVSQRSKEDAHDYRYFPEPDIPPLDMNKFDLAAIKLLLPELPQEKRVRFVKEYGLSDAQIETLVQDRDMAAFFENSISELETEDTENLARETQLIINYLSSDIRGALAEWGIGFGGIKLTPENFADLIELISHEKITSRTAKDLLNEMIQNGGDPNTLLKEKGLEQVSDEGALMTVVDKVIVANPKPVSDYKAGKMNALQFLVGMAMKELKGTGHPKTLSELFISKLK
jgi:aspartyl-tRNA(Asn)/glutamyl-tRNA(Gln) amidotransferase subunit B